MAPEKRLRASASPANTATTPVIQAAFSPSVQPAAATPPPATTIMAHSSRTVSQPSSSLNMHSLEKTIDCVRNLWAGPGEAGQHYFTPAGPDSFKLRAVSRKANKGHGRRTEDGGRRTTTSARALIANSPCESGLCDPYAKNGDRRGLGPAGPHFSREHKSKGDVATLGVPTLGVPTLGVATGDVATGDVGDFAPTPNARFRAWRLPGCYTFGAIGVQKGCHSGSDYFTAGGCFGEGPEVGR